MDSSGRQIGHSAASQGSRGHHNQRRSYCIRSTGAIQYFGQGYFSLDPAEIRQIALMRNSSLRRVAEQFGEGSRYRYKIVISIKFILSLKNTEPWTLCSFILVHLLTSLSSQTQHHRGSGTVSRDKSEWSNQETAVIVYFACRHVDHLGCSRFLVRKTGERPLVPRTASDVEKRLNEVMRKHNLCDSNVEWDCSKVDAWLTAMGLCNLGALVEVGMEELQMVAPIRS